MKNEIDIQDTKVHIERLKDLLVKFPELTPTYKIQITDEIDFWNKQLTKNKEKE